MGSECRRTRRAGAHQGAGALTPTRPLLRYHGGKWRLAPWIISHMPKHRVYVESFGGGGSVLIRKDPSYAEIYNDLDGEIVNLFRVARDRGAELVDKIRLTPFARDEFMESYEPSGDPMEQARRTMVRCGMGFGSSAMNTSNKTGFRGSATRSGTHPGTDWKNQPKNLSKIITRLQGVVIENKDALELIQYHDAATTLHYVDPPYVHESRTWQGGKEAYRHEMDDDQHRQLAAVLNDVKGMVILSGYPTPLYEELFAGWIRVEREAMADKAAARTEVLWLRNVPDTGQQEMQL